MTPHDSFATCMRAFADALGVALPERSEGDGEVVLAIDGTEVSFREDADGGTVVLAAETNQHSKTRRTTPSA